VFDHLPLFLTVEQAAKELQLGRSKAYELTVQWERTNGASGLPFVWFGAQKRIPRQVLAVFVDRALHPTSAT
jgi:hypothetical protein